MHLKRFKSLTHVALLRHGETPSGVMHSFISVNDMSFIVINIQCESKNPPEVF